MPLNNFHEAERYLVDKHDDAVAAIARWEKFESENPTLTFDLYNVRREGSFQKVNEAWQEFIDNHADLNFSPTESRDLLDGLLLQRTWVDEGSPNLSAPLPEESAVGETAFGKWLGEVAAGAGNVRSQPQFIEDDDQFQEIEQRIQSDWKKDRADYLISKGLVEPNQKDYKTKEEYREAMQAYSRKADATLQASKGTAKDFSQEAEVNCLYGSLDGKTKSVHDRAIEELLAQKNTLNGKLEQKRFGDYLKSKQLRKDRARLRQLEFYERQQESLEAYTGHEDGDILMFRTKQRILQHQHAREWAAYQEFLGTPEGRNVSFDDFRNLKKYGNRILGIRRQVAQAEWNRFIAKKRARLGDKWNAQFEARYAKIRDDYLKALGEEMNAVLSEASFLPQATIFPEIPRVTEETGQHEQPAQEYAPANEEEQQNQPQQQGGPRKRGIFNRLAKKGLEKLGKRLGMNIGEQGLRQIITQILSQGFQQIIRGIISLLANPEISIPLAAIVLVVVLIILIFIIFPGHPILPTIPIKCGDDTQIQQVIYESSGDPFYDMSKQITQPYFHINFTAVDETTGGATNTISRGGPHFIQAQAAAQSAISAVCLLFGHREGDPYNPKQYINTFGQLVVGTDAERQSGKANPILLAIAFAKTNDKCLVNYINKKTIELINPDSCPSEAQLQFKLAEALGYSAIDQQFHIHGNNNFSIFNDFLKLTAPKGPYVLDPLLPTKKCHPPAGTTINIDQNQKDCFADMVGEYLVYPYYLDTDPIETKAGTQSAMIVPNFIDYPYGEFTDYFFFAKSRLFNDKEFFIRNENTAECPNPSPADPVGELKKWGFTLTYNNPSLATDKYVKDTYNTICLLYQSPTFRKLVGSETKYGGIEIYYEGHNDTWSGLTEGRKITLRNMEDTQNVWYKRFILSHELGHVIQNYNPQIGIDFTHVYSTKTFPNTINCPMSNYNGDPDRQRRECFSDFEGLYVTFTKFDAYASPSLKDFATNPKWINYYNFIKQELFGGIEFWGSGIASSTGDYAQNLAQAIIQTCPPPVDPNRKIGYVYKQDMGCLDNLSGFKPKPDVILALKSGILPLCGPSGCTRPNLQCVGFVHAVSVGVGADIGVGHGDAKNYIGLTIKGYRWIANPNNGSTSWMQAGDFAVFKGNHIGVVVGVLSNGSVKFAEANGGSGSVDVTTFSANAILTYTGGLAGVQRRQ